MRCFIRSSDTSKPFWLNRPLRREAENDTPNIEQTPTNTGVYYTISIIRNPQNSIGNYDGLHINNGACGQGPLSGSLSAENSKATKS